MKKIVPKQKYLFFVTLFFLIAIIIVVYKTAFNNNIKNVGVANIKYRTLSNNNKWGNWAENGESSGFENGYITKLDIKLSNKYEKSFGYTIYNDKNKKGKFHHYDDKSKFKYANGISFSLNSNMIREYDVCYRTYNNKDKWLDWTCNDSISGNYNEKISKIELKVIPKNVLKREYLEDYGMIDESQKNF